MHDYDVWRSIICFSDSTAGGLHLGIDVTSDGNQSTILKALQLLLQVLPEGLLYGRKPPGFYPYECFAL